MEAGPASAADWIVDEFPLTQDPIRIETVIVRIAVREGWFASVAEAEVAAERWAPKVATRLTNSLNAARARGWPTRFEFNSSNPDAIQGACFAEPLDSDELKSAKSAGAFADDYLTVIRGLTGRQFEAVCRGVLVLLDCSDAVLTPRSGDQGIDFFGRIPMVGRLGRVYVRGSIDRAMSTWVVGQAKQIGEPVGSGEVRELIGAIEGARRQISTDDGKALKELDLKPYGSAFGFFITTGDFTRGALQLIDQYGLLAMDGPAVASFLAEHAVADNSGSFDATVFDAWLATHET